MWDWVNNAHRTGCIAETYAGMYPRAWEMVQWTGGFSVQAGRSEFRSPEPKSRFVGGGDRWFPGPYLLAANLASDSTCLKGVRERVMEKDTQCL